MKARKAILMLGLVLGVSACASSDQTGYNARMAPFVSDTLQAPVVTPANDVRFSVSAVRVSVPAYLRVSESKLLYPLGADIVWHGDPDGNRYQQVKAIFKAGITRGVQTMRGNREVIAYIVVRKFHALSTTARAFTGGVHSISFLLTLRDAKTGKVVMGPHVINADLKAFGGRHARLAEKQGQTQKVRIVDHLARVIVAELTPPYDGKRVHVLKMGSLDK